MALLRRPATIGDVVRKAPTSEVRGAIGALVAATATINDALDQLESSPEEHAALRGELLAAVSLALARVPSSEAKGLSLARVNGKERLVVNPEMVAAALWKDPQALDPLLSGEEGTLEVLDAMLGTDTNATSAAPSPPPEHGPGADAAPSPSVLAHMRTLQSMDGLPSISRHRLELLV